MMKKLLNLSLALLLAFSLVACLGGDEDGDDEEETIKDITVFMFNDSDAFIHIMAPGEFIDPSNRVEVGAHREEFLGQVEKGETIRFRAGRRGIICQEIFCEVTNIDNEDHEVKWVNAPSVDKQMENLDCLNGFKLISRAVLDAFCSAIDI